MADKEVKIQNPGLEFLYNDISKGEGRTIVVPIDSKSLGDRKVAYNVTQAVIMDTPAVAHFDYFLRNSTFLAFLRIANPPRKRGAVESPPKSAGEVFSMTREDWLRGGLTEEQVEVGMTATQTVRERFIEGQLSTGSSFRFTT